MQLLDKDSNKINMIEDQVGTSLPQADTNNKDTNSKANSEDLNILLQAVNSEDVSRLYKNFPT